MLVVAITYFFIENFQEEISQFLLENIQESIHVPSIRSGPFLNLFLDTNIRNSQGRQIRKGKMNLQWERNTSVKLLMT